MHTGDTRGSDACEMTKARFLSACHILSILLLSISFPIFLVDRKEEWQEREVTENSCSHRSLSLVLSHRTLSQTVEEAGHEDLQRHALPQTV